eukprot:1795147-Amphidinium_carterae.1
MSNGSNTLPNAHVTKHDAGAGATAQRVTSKSPTVSGAPRSPSTTLRSTRNSAGTSTSSSAASSASTRSSTSSSATSSLTTNSKTTTSSSKTSTSSSTSSSGIVWTNVDWDQASATFVIGSVGAFFHGNLQPGEIDCLTAGTGKVVSIIVDSVIGFVEAVETAVGATDLTTVAPIVDETTGGTAQTLADLEQEEAEKESKGQVKERLLAKHHYYFPVTEAPFHLNGVVASVPK